jgi:ribose transport system permease protein
VVKFDDRGEVVDSLWDPDDANYPTISALREHKGYLYIGCLENNRIGRLHLPDANPCWTSWDSYYGKGMPVARTAPTSKLRSTV